MGRLRELEVDGDEILALGQQLLESEHEAAEAVAVKIDLSASTAEVATSSRRPRLVLRRAGYEDRRCHGPCRRRSVVERRGHALPEGRSSRRHRDVVHQAPDRFRRATTRRSSTVRRTRHRRRHRPRRRATDRSATPSSMRLFCDHLQRAPRRRTRARRPFSGVLKFSEELGLRRRAGMMKEGGTFDDRPQGAQTLFQTHATGAATALLEMLSCTVARSASTMRLIGLSPRLVPAARRRWQR